MGSNQSPSCSGYDVILPAKLFVGDQHAAQDAKLLDSLCVTHIIACGFNRGHLEDSGRYRYLCLDPLLDGPNENLLRYLARATAFIGSALEGETSGAVFVHCVHGQSRSCAVCVAYLMQLEVRSAVGERKRAGSPAAESVVEVGRISAGCPSGGDSGGDMLMRCFEAVHRARPCMAINPGFVRQLEMFRRMGCTVGGKWGRSCKGPRLSRAHAAARTFRACTEYRDTMRVSKFFPVVPGTTEELLLGTSEMYRCKRCRMLLFFHHNIAADWKDEDDKALPISEYWKQSAGGREYAKRSKKLSTNIEKNRHGDNLEQILMQVEPMDWMETQMLSPGDSQARGKLVCPNCQGKLGSWDFYHKDPYVCIFIVSTKIDSSRS